MVVVLLIGVVLKTGFGEPRRYRLTGRVSGATGNGADNRGRVQGDALYRVRGLARHESAVARIVRIATMPMKLLCIRPEREDLRRNPSERNYAITARTSSET